MIRDKKPRFFYGYIVVLAGLLIMGVSTACSYTFAIFLKPLLTEFGWTRAMASGATSLRAWLATLLGIGAGRLTDKFGLRPVLTGCGLFLGLGFFLMSQISTIWQLYLVYGVLIAAAMSTAWIPLASTVPRWFVKRRTTMQGIMLAGGGLGMTIWPMLASQLISNYGWRTSYMIIGAIGLIVVTPIAQFMRRAPEQMEQSPHSRDEVKQENSNRQMMGHSLHQAVRTRKFWLLCAIYGCLWFSGNAIWVHLAIHATDLGISAASAATILAIMGGMSIAGRILMGSVADRIGYKLTLLIGFALMAAGLLWLLVAKELWAFYLFAVVFSFGPASLAALQAPLTAELFGLGSLGVILGGIECVSTVFGAISPILAGYIFDVTNSYRLVFLILATSSVIGLILSMLIRPTNNKGGGNDSGRST